MNNAPKVESRRMVRARLIRDGLSWRAACLQAGYSLSVANKGMKQYTNGSANENRTRSILRPGIIKDFERAARETPYAPDFIKKAVTHRLMTSVLEGKTSNVAREAELLGKMRDVDIFVRNADVQVGVFAAMLDPAAGQLLDATDAAISRYRD